MGLQNFIRLKKIKKYVECFLKGVLSDILTIFKYKN